MAGENSQLRPLPYRITHVYQSMAGPRHAYRFARITLPWLQRPSTGDGCNNQLMQTMQIPIFQDIHGYSPLTSSDPGLCCPYLHGCAILI